MRLQRRGGEERVRKRALKQYADRIESLHRRQERRPVRQPGQQRLRCWCLPPEATLIQDILRQKAALLDDDERVDAASAAALGGVSIRRYPDVYHHDESCLYFDDDLLGGACIVELRNRA